VKARGDKNGWDHSEYVYPKIVRDAVEVYLKGEGRGGGVERGTPWKRGVNLEKESWPGRLQKEDRNRLSDN